MSNVSVADTVCTDSCAVALPSISAAAMARPISSRGWTLRVFKAIVRVYLHAHPTSARDRHGRVRHEPYLTVERSKEHKRSTVSCTRVYIHVLRIQLEFEVRISVRTPRGAPRACHTGTESPPLVLTGTVNTETCFMSMQGSLNSRQNRSK